jgi:hypothetical protein
LFRLFRAEGDLDYESHKDKEQVSVGFSECRKGSISTNKWRQITFPGMQTANVTKQGGKPLAAPLVLVRLSQLQNQGAGEETADGEEGVNEKATLIQDSNSVVSPVKAFSPTKFNAAAMAVDTVAQAGVRA